MGFLYQPLLPLFKRKSSAYAHNLPGRLTVRPPQPATPLVRPPARAR